MKMKKNAVSTQELFGVKSFSRNGIMTDGHGELVYFSITPTNISVLSRTSIGLKIHNLMQLLSAQPDMEIVCMDARESFDANKLYLDERCRTETNKKVQALLDKDKRFLDDIQTRMSTAREFLFVLRLRDQTDEQSFANLNRIEKLINEQGFACRRAEKDDVKRILSRYFGIAADEKPIDDTDGEIVMQKWVIPD